jgi:hypothetical protein
MGEDTYHLRLRCTHGAEDLPLAQGVSSPSKVSETMAPVGTTKRLAKRK